MVENIELFTQNSIRIVTIAGVVYIDPFRIRQASHDADFILITHDHYDHFSDEDIEKVAGDNTVLIIPEKMNSQTAGLGRVATQTESVRPGMHYSINGLELDTVVSYNINKSFHPKNAGWVGYVIYDNDKRIYVAGDTDATKEAEAVKCDIAMIPIGGTFTMDYREAAELINAMKPAIAIPTHYGSIVGDKRAADMFAKAVDSDIKVEVIMQ